MHIKLQVFKDNFKYLSTILTYYASKSLKKKKKRAAQIVYWLPTFKIKSLSMSTILSPNNKDWPNQYATFTKQMITSRE
jgi:hypothetical protein